MATTIGVSEEFRDKIKEECPTGMTHEQFLRQELDMFEDPDVEPEEGHWHDYPAE